MDNSIEILAEISHADRSFAEKTFGEKEVSHTFYEVNRIDSIFSLDQVIVGGSITAVSQIIIAFIKSQKDICVKYKGIEIRGLTVKNVQKILNQLVNTVESNNEEAK